MRDGCVGFGGTSLIHIQKIRLQPERRSTVLYNAQRQKVRDWREGDISTCPDCSRSLFPKRGEAVGWHWAHYADPQHRTACGHRETPWHLAWKAVYDEFSGWSVEERICGFRADAVNLGTRSLREFVHCLSPYYLAKHRVFSALKFDIRWIFDGEEFTSRRLRNIAKGGVSRLLGQTG